MKNRISAVQRGYKALWGKYIPIYLFDAVYPRERTTIAAHQGSNVFATVDQRSDEISAEVTGCSRN
jgi:hypothetical protein